MSSVVSDNAATTTTTPMSSAHTPNTTSINATFTTFRSPELAGAGPVGVPSREIRHLDALSRSRVNASWSELGVSVRSCTPPERPAGQHH